MHITIPANTTATLFVPAKNAVGVAESGRPAAQAESVKSLRMENHAAVYAIGPETYWFHPENHKANLPAEMPLLFRDLPQAQAIRSLAPEKRGGREK